MEDALELELRQLPGVSFVSFSDQGGATVIELLVRPGHGARQGARGSGALRRQLPGGAGRDPRRRTRPATSRAGPGREGDD